MANVEGARYAERFDSNQLTNWATWFVFAVFIVFALRYQLELLTFQEWGDESETIVAAKMIAAGESLYSQVFNHHGPLTFLPGVVLEQFGSFGITGHRAVIAALQLLSLAAICFSPLVVSSFARALYVLIALSVMLLIFPDWYGHTYKYQVLAGLLIAVVLAQYTMPAIIKPHSLGRSRVVVGNLCIASIPFLAITFIPLAILLFIASLRRRRLGLAITAFFGGVAANVLFLASIGSIKGFFAYHVYLNTVVLPEYLPQYNGSIGMLSSVNTAYVTATGDLAHLLVLIGAALSFSLLAAAEYRFPWRSLLLAMGLGSLLIRGGGFHALPYYYALLSLPLAYIQGRASLPPSGRLLFIGLAAILVTKVSLLMPGAMEKLDAKRLPTSSEFSELVRLLTEPGDRIIAYSFQNTQYLVSDRLPASGHFFYLPWQEKYNEAPRYGIRIDACEDIKRHRPKVMLIDKWKVWNAFTWESYASCVQELIDTEYTQVPGKPYYIRNDLMQDEWLQHVASPDSEMRPSAPLSLEHKVSVMMSRQHIENGKPLVGLGIMFGTYMRENQGEAKLVLRSEAGSTVSRTFSLPELQDNRYEFFEFEPGVYSEAELNALSGGGVSAWTLYEGASIVATCLIYRYADGSRRVTPGCSPF